ncbi:hypothetical protein CerSpe_122550 [Prunus speciosa]
MEITPALIICNFLHLVLTSSAKTCSDGNFSTNRIFTSCSDLLVLQARLHWNYIPSTRSIQIAYRATQASTVMAVYTTPRGAAKSS